VAHRSAGLVDRGAALGRRSVPHEPAPLAARAPLALPRRGRAGAGRVHHGDAAGAHHVHGAVGRDERGGVLVHAHAHAVGGERDGHAQASLAAALAEVLVDDEPRGDAQPRGHAHDAGARPVARPAARDHVLAQEARPGARAGEGQRLLGEPAPEQAGARRVTEHLRQAHLVAAGEEDAVGAAELLLGVGVLAVDAVPEVEHHRLAGPVAAEGFGVLVARAREARGHGDHGDPRARPAAQGEEALEDRRVAECAADGHEPAAAGGVGGQVGRHRRLVYSIRATGSLVGYRVSIPRWPTPVLTLLRGAELYDPAPRGRCDVLVGGERVVWIGAADALPPLPPALVRGRGGARGPWRSCPG
jgi:hypothetical protein